MPSWNCRLIERNNAKCEHPWISVDAHNAQRAAAAYCGDSRVWDRISWHEDDDGIVEVEMHGGEDGTHRMVIGAYTVLEFSATPEEETV